MLYTTSIKELTTTIKYSNTDVRGGVPQGSWLGPILFILTINDLQPQQCKTHKYMDDTTITECLGPMERSNMPHILQEVNEWSNRHKMNLNATKTKEMVVSFTKTPFPDELELNNAMIKRVNHCKLLGITIQCDLKWDIHINHVLSKAARRIFFLASLRRAGVKSEQLLLYYNACIRSMMEYGSEVFHAGLTQKQSADLEAVQSRALHIIRGSEASSDSPLITLSQRRHLACKKLFVKICDPDHRLHHLLPPPHAGHYNLRKRRKFSCNGHSSTNRFDTEFVNFCIKNFNYDC